MVQNCLTYPAVVIKHGKQEQTYQGPTARASWQATVEKNRDQTASECT